MSQRLVRNQLLTGRTWTVSRKVLTVEKLSSPFFEISLTCTIGSQQDGARLHAAETHSFNFSSRKLASGEPPMVQGGDV